MSGNFVRERQRIVYIYNIHIVYYICKQYVAARARNFQTFLGRLCLAAMFEVTHDGRHVRHGVKMHRQNNLRFQVLYGSDSK